MVGGRDGENGTRWMGFDALFLGGRGKGYWSGTRGIAELLLFLSAKSTCGMGRLSTTLTALPAPSCN